MLCLSGFELYSPWVPLKSLKTPSAQLQLAACVVKFRLPSGVIRVPTNLLEGG